MRITIGLAALVVGLALAGPASAQQRTGFGFSQTSNVSRLSTPQSRGYISPANFLGSGFRLRDIFGDWGNISNRHYIGTSTIPRPDSPEYLKAFGFRRLQ
jgi:hypothetical protein